ncbi:hypothetical protein CR513_22031, partial [Mucuna pruriens]
MTYTKLFPLLLEQKLIEVVPLKPLESPYPRSYGLNTRCDYHDDGLLGFEDKGPNVHSNPLLAHGVMAINAISHKDGRAESPDRSKEGSYLHQLGENCITTIAYIEGKGNSRPKPLIIQYNLALKLRVPARPVYNNNAVPWRYLTEEPKAPQITKEIAAPEITNIVGIEGMTRSGRIFTLEALRNRDPTPTKKEKIVETPKRMVTKEEAHEFLKIIRHSEYEMLDQLHKTPARISLLSLLINSESHHELLLKILRRKSQSKVEAIINPFISQSNNECSLNVMPKTTLDKLYSPGATLKNSPVVVKAFDGSKQEVMGKITLPIRIGPTTFDITFQVMDIRPAYNCLLGQPWMHAAGEFPSSLHQKVEFIANGQLISVMGEKEMMVNIPLPTEYVERNEEALETSF